MDREFNIQTVAHLAQKGFAKNVCFSNNFPFIQPPHFKNAMHACRCGTLERDYELLIFQGSPP